MSNTENPSEELRAQRDYTERLVQESFDFGLTVADAFVRGIRDIGYRDTSTALDEHLDNAIQAGADKLLVALDLEGKADLDSAIAVCDNGHGMDPDMIRLSVIWGGTHRENDRRGFGRYGYGLPSAAVSQGRRFTVFSRTTDGDSWHSVTLDLDEISAGAHTKNGNIQVPEAGTAELPEWLEAALEERFEGGLEHGTIVLMEKLDRLTWSTRSALERNLLQRIGTTYRNFLRGTEVWVADKRVEPVDPLFITPGARFYDLDEDRAEALDPHSFDVRDRESREHLGTVKVRYSYMPPTFARVDKSVERGKNNARFPILADHNGIIVLREGRQIDVVSQRGRLSVNNDDRYWGVEIDVPATLDEEMSITTSKQRVILSDRIWDLLDQEGVLANITAFRKRYDDDKARLKANREDDDAQRTSEQAMEASDKYKTGKTPDSEERRKRSRASFEREVDRRTRESGVSRKEVERQLEAEAKGRRYRMEEDASAGAPFFRVEQVGPQKVLYLNTSHRFYKDVYAGPDSTPRLRAGIEVLLFSIGSGEVDADGERRTFYETERGLWSTILNGALSELAKIDAPDEVRPTEAEERELLEAKADQ